MLKNILIAALALALLVVSVAGGVYYGQTSKYVTPDVMFQTAKTAAKNKCVDSLTNLRSACEELILANVTPIDLGNDITGSVYTFKSSNFPSGQSIDVMISYSSYVYRVDTPHVSP